MPRAVWKGAISFGLVHLPVSLFPATQDSGIDFQWLDRRSLDPVGYKRYNKRTGMELKMQDIVKGVRQPNGKYVVVTDEEIRAAFPKSTQTIQIESFVKRSELPFMMLERPYYIQPASKSEKVYVLLREAMREADVVAVARLVIHNKEHLAAIVISDTALVLDVLRWAGDVRSPGQLGLPGRAGSAAGIKLEERKMASQLIQQMTGAWKTCAYAEQFTGAIGTLIRRNPAAGEAHRGASGGPVSASHDQCRGPYRALGKKHARAPRSRRGERGREQSAHRRAPPAYDAARATTGGPLSVPARGNRCSPDPTEHTCTA
jgi:DNA end-binding protein Ku